MNTVMISLGVTVLAIFPCLIPAGVAVYYEKWHEKRTQRQEFQEKIEGTAGERSSSVFDSSFWTG